MQEKEYIVWDFGGDMVRQESIRGMDELAGSELTNLKDGDITKSEYIKKEAWGYYPWIEALFKKSEMIIGKKISGVVGDLGSGTGVVAAIMSKFSDVKKVYAIEYSEEHVKKVMPVTFDFLSAQKEKIVRVVGSFNTMKVEDNFFDFLSEVNSLHHAEDLGVTVKEIYRVLKPGGFLIAFDRGHANWVSDDYLQKQLDIQLSSKQKKLYNLPENFTRGMWGEHEYRFAEWKNVFRKNGFEVFAFVFPRKNPKILNIFAKIFFSIFGDLMLRAKIDYVPYYRWFCPFFKGSNMLLVAKKLK